MSNTIVNPYKTKIPINIVVESSPFAPKPKLTSNKPSNIFEKMTQAQQELQQKQKEKAAKKSANETKNKGGSTKSRVFSVAATARRNAVTAKKGRENSSDSIGSWSLYTMGFLKKLRTKFNNSVGFEERGKHKFRGAWPLWAMSPIIQPSADPLTFQKYMFGNDTNNEVCKESSSSCSSDESADESLSDDEACKNRASNKVDNSIVINSNENASTGRSYHPTAKFVAVEVPLLKKDDFSLPDVMIYAPELRWPHLYPDGRPGCVFHDGCTSCVRRKGIFHYPRLCYGESGVVALYSSYFCCKVRKENKNGKEKETFFSHDEKVIAMADPLVKAFWSENGFHVTHKSAISFRVIERGRSLLAHGSGVSGYHKSIKEAYQQRHWNTRKKWLAYIQHSVKTDKDRDKTDLSLFYDFDELESNAKFPSLNYLLQSIIEKIEANMQYYTRKMQRVWGLCLSGDHSHKIAKVVLINGERGFEGMYTIMNEFGKVLGFWFVNGTTLREVEDALRGINRRYHLHGFEGPNIFSTDNCCNEREFFAGKQNGEGKPIFSSFGIENENDMEAEAENEDSSRKTVQQITLPEKAIRVYSLDVAEVTVGDIIRKCSQNKWEVVGIDSEWEIGRSRNVRTRNGQLGPDTFQVGLLDGSTYVFLLRLYKIFPRSLETLLEDPTIGKVAHNISSDQTKLKEIGIKIQNGINLGRVAKERGVVQNANASLYQIVLSLFSCHMNKDDTVRLSNWSSQARGNLTDEQVEYAALDAYAHVMSYLKLTQMAYIDPKKERKPALSDLKIGDNVFLYGTGSRSSSLVASGTAIEIGHTNQTPLGVTRKSMAHIVVRVSKDDVRQLSARVERKENVSFNALFEELEKSENPPAFIDVPWKISRLWINTIPESSPSKEISVSTKEIDIPFIEEDSVDEEAVNVDVPEFPEDDGGIEDSDGDDELEWTLQNNINNIKGGKRVKQDIEHVFIRFGNVLKKKHGVFGDFMARLSDAFFHPSQEDLQFIKKALHKAGLSDDDIKKKKWHFFKRRVRRRVPPPKVLEHDFCRVVNLFANVKDAKTGEVFFRKKAWNLFTSTLRHIRKGCLSDIPEMAYYIQTHEDSYGIPVLKCLRGTSALEGFHQKIRQLVRGFHISPRFVIALLHEFIHRWNHNIDIRILGLPRKYAQFYDGWEIEEEVKVVSTWDDVAIDAHDDFDSILGCDDTGEVFGLIKEKRRDNDCSNDGHEEDLELVEEILNFTDALEDGTLDDENDDDAADGVLYSHQQVTASAAWVNAKMGRDRGWGPVNTETEKEFFINNVHRYPNDGREADNYSPIAFGSFATAWNEIVMAESSGDRPKTDMTFKSWYHLHAYYKKVKKEANRATTVLPIHDANNTLRKDMRYGRSSAIPQAISAESHCCAASSQPKNSSNDQPVPATDLLPQAASLAAAHADNLQPSSRSESNDTNNTIGDDVDRDDADSLVKQLGGYDTQNCFDVGEDTLDIDASVRNDNATNLENGGDSTACESQTTETIPGKSSSTVFQDETRPTNTLASGDSDGGAMNRKKRNPKRCRQCGHPPIFSTNFHKGYHYGRQNIQPHNMCTVPIALRMPKFPLKEGMPFPRRDRNRENAWHRRCRGCGHYPAQSHTEFHIGYHLGPNSVQPHSVCTVPPTQRAPRFPLKEGKDFPRKQLKRSMKP